MLRDVIAQPTRLRALTPDQWDVVLRQARAAGLMARLSFLLEEYAAGPSVPTQIRRHFDAERLFATKLAGDVEREVRHIVTALRSAAVPIVALKGTAYILGELPPARGRIFTDIDILVPEDRIDVAEQRLLAAGWREEKKSAWDQRFYRRWMHQIPPMVHATRESEIDLHFAIVPRRGRTPLASEPLFEGTRRSVRNPAVKLLAPCDMVLHCAVHLFNDSVFDRALRDLVDLDLLLRGFGETPDFWMDLVRRADALGLGRPLYYALRYTTRLLSTPIPAAVIEATRSFAPAMPFLMDAVFDRGLRAEHATARDRLTALSMAFLYARGHWLRLPLYLLIPHLLRGLFVRAVLRSAIR